MRSEYVKETLGPPRLLYDVYNEALVDLARANRNVVALYADFPSGAAGEVFHNEFPDRIYNFGISEANMITAAGGLAAAGEIPFAHCYSIFGVGRAYNQIRQNIAVDQYNVKLVFLSGGIIGFTKLGVSHQAIEDIAALRAIPNLIILSPADVVEIKKAVTAASKYVGPIVFRLSDPATCLPTLYGDDYHFQIGKAVTLRDGKDLTIIATGIMVFEALGAAKGLAEKGISARVLNMHTIKPIDERAVLSACEDTGAIVTVEDANITGGLGGAVAEVVVENIPVPMSRIGVRDTFGQCGTVEELKNAYGMSVSDIIMAAEGVVKRKRSCV